MTPLSAYSAPVAGSTVRAAVPDRTPAAPAALTSGLVTIGLHIQMSPNEPL